MAMVKLIPLYQKIEQDANEPNFKQRRPSPCHFLFSTTSHYGPWCLLLCAKSLLWSYASHICFIPFTSDPWTTQGLGVQDPQRVENPSTNFWLPKSLTAPSICGRLVPWLPADAQSHRCSSPPCKMEQISACGQLAAAPTPKHCGKHTGIYGKNPCINESTVQIHVVQRSTVFNFLSFKKHRLQCPKLISQASHGSRSAFCKLAQESELRRQWSVFLYLCSSELVSSGRPEAGLGSPAHTVFHVKMKFFRSGSDCPLQLHWYNLGRIKTVFFF